MPADKPERWWLRASEVGELAGVGAKTIKRWLKAGRLRGYQLNGKGEHRILVLQLVNYCKANPDMHYILEQFNERYTVAPIFRKPVPTTGTEGATGCAHN